MRRPVAAPPAPAEPPPPAEVLARKGGQRVSVVLPALNEAATVGAIVSDIHRDLVTVGVVDELVVMDSGSSDRTAQLAREAGATVYHRDDVLPEWGSLPGKGEVMWKSLAVTSGDIVVFLDADLVDFRSSHVTSLVLPLLLRPGLHVVKGAWDRPLGRVTELVARPLLGLYWPELASVVQPLAGEYAVRRPLLEALSFPSGYGVDIALLVDAYRRHGAAAIAQVDLGLRLHRHHEDHQLGVMAAEVIQAALLRLGQESTGQALTRFHRDGGVMASVAAPLVQTERPPIASLRDADARPA